MAARLKQTRRWDYLRCAALMVSATTVMTDSMMGLPPLRCPDGQRNYSDDGLDDDDYLAVFASGRTRRRGF